MMAMLNRQTKDNIAKLFGFFRLIVVGGMRTPLDMQKKLLVELPVSNIYNCYGLTETGVSAINYRERAKFSAAGKPLSGMEIKIADRKNTPVKSSVENPGRIMVRGDMVMKGYWETNLYPQKQPFIDGWLITNDIGYIDEDGDLFILGRSDDVIWYNKDHLSLSIIEDAANTFPAIKESCCIGIEDHQGINEKLPVLFVTVKDKEASSEEILYRHLKKHLNIKSLPHKIIIIDDMPLNSNGKYLRSELQRIYNQDTAFV
jgi:long-chain acyl-CoA synthetase